MVDFGPSSHNWAKFLNTINLEPLELWPWNFQDLLSSSVPIIGQNFKEIWDIMVTCRGWLYMELPQCQFHMVELAHYTSDHRRHYLFLNLELSWFHMVRPNISPSTCLLLLSRPYPNNIGLPSWQRPRHWF